MQKIFTPAVMENEIEKCMGMEIQSMIDLSVFLLNIIIDLL
jgi:hypothetical protein